MLLFNVFVTIQCISPEQPCTCNFPEALGFNKQREYYRLTKKGMEAMLREFLQEDLLNLIDRQTQRLVERFHGNKNLREKVQIDFGPMATAMCRCLLVSKHFTDTFEEIEAVIEYMNNLKSGIFQKVHPKLQCATEIHILNRKVEYVKSKAENTRTKGADYIQKVKELRVAIDKILEKANQVEREEDKVISQERVPILQNGTTDKTAIVLNQPGGLLILHIQHPVENNQNKKHDK